MILNDIQASRLEEHNNNIRSYKLNKQQAANQVNKLSSTSTGSNKPSNTASSKQVKILKSFYQKDALASVAKSFLDLDQRYATTGSSIVGLTGSKLGDKKELSKLSIGAISVATTATSASSDLVLNNTNNNHTNNSPPSEQNSSSQSYVSSNSNKYNDTNINTRASSNNKQHDNSYEFDDENNTTSSNQVSSSSCTLFVNKLVGEKIQRLNSIETSSIKVNRNDHDYQVVDIPDSQKKMYPQQQYYRQQQALYQQQQQAQYYPACVTEKRQLYLLSKKLRKFLPFNYGLKNHGNTCFMNCVLQSLFHTSPLCEYFVTEQHENDIKLAQHDYETSRHVMSHANSQRVPSVVLTRHFHRLLLSMWQNTYESVYSVQLKNLIGELNPTFAGVNQNDSHEFCVWLLDRLSQELSYKIEVDKRQRDTDNDVDGEQHDTNDRSKTEVVSRSFIEDLFKVEFKSTVICSKCKYKSTKCETDMMLSLPLPQQHANGFKPATIQPPPLKKYQRKSLYANIIFTNQFTWRQFLPSAQFVTENNQNISMSNGMMMPLNVKIAFNVHMTTDDAYPDRELVRLSDSSANNTVINPAFADLRHYLSSMYKLDEARLVFVDLAETADDLVDTASVRERIVKSRGRLAVDSDQEPTLFVVELNSQQAAPGEQEMLPLINLIAFNVYYKQTSRSTTNERVMINFGVPFVVLINRDCSYSELCQKLLETQVKYFKDKNILKYKELADKLFNISLIDTESKQSIRINPNDELPLYAQCVDKALTHSHKISAEKSKFLEHVKVNIEWRSFDDLATFFTNLNSPRVDFTHKTVHVLRSLDESDEKPILASVQPPGAVLASQSSQFFPSTGASTTTPDPMHVTLSDCFELFTQTEELSDENSWKCSKCKQQTNAYKNLSISVAPPILIIHLKRFFYKSNTSNFKLTTPVSFPVTSLDIDKYVSNGSGNRSSRSENRPPIIYDLFAVCNHKGQNMANGHYTAFCKNTVDSRWYCFDDSNCTPLVDAPTNGIFNTGFNQVCTENAYILFYKKRGCMTNDHWWVNYVDRYLFNSQEFVDYCQDLPLIERRQQQYESQVQTVPSGNKSSQEGNAVVQSATVKKPTSLRSSIKNKLLGKSGTSSEMDSYDQTDSNEFYYHQRESSRPRSHQPQYHQTYNGNLIDMNDNSYATSVNYYDENNKPKRIQQKQNSNSSSLTSTTSTNNSTPSHHNHRTSGHRPLEYSQQGYVNGYNRVDGLANGFDEMKLSDTNGGDLMLLNYPSDNEIVYQQNKQRVLDSYNQQSRVNNGTMFHHYPPNYTTTSRNYQYSMNGTPVNSSAGVYNMARATSQGGSSSNNRSNNQRSHHNPNVETNI